MHRFGSLTIALGLTMCLAGCSGSSQSSSSSSPSPSAAPARTAMPDGTKTPVTFTFTDVAVATGGSNTLRLGFVIVNGSADPQLCDPSEFSIQLDDGTVIQADDSADNSCDPNSVDPSSSGKVVMYFDLPGSYTGGLKLIMIANDAIVGQGSTTVK
jgi:hypothetical protein